MIYRMLTYGRLADDFEAFIKVSFPEIDIAKANSKSEIRSALPTVNAIAGFNFLTDEDLSEIEWIHAFGAGVDSYLRLQSLSPETIITRTTGNLGRQMGEFCLAYILAEIKSLFPIYENQKIANWNQISATSLSALNVLVLGTGSVGQGIGFQLTKHVSKLIGLNQSGTSVDPFDEIISWESLSTVKDIHVVVSALPSTEETSSILDESFFESFKNIIFINVGRGDAVEENALTEAISSGSVRKAVLDVFPEEPLVKDSNLWTNEKVLVSPHQSGITTIDDVIASFKTAYAAIQKGERNHLFIDQTKGY